MRIIISPAKKMNINTDLFEISHHPVHIERTKLLLKHLQTKNYSELKSLWKCNDKLAQLNMERIQSMDIQTTLTPALLSYEGLQYQYIAPSVMDNSQWEYINHHLRILSGFYGILRPLDGVTPYRLEMQAALVTEHGKNLYEFWGNTLYQALTAETDTIINLASKEYSKVIEPFLADHITYITCVFGEEKDGKVIEKGTYAKMARGEMVRFMAEQSVSAPEQMLAFDRLGFRYEPVFSDKNTFVFLRA